MKLIQLMIGGAQKAGTTSLFQYLSQHPAVHTHYQREFSFFVNDSAYQRGYSSVYPEFFPDYIRPEDIVLAKHVMLMYCPQGLQRLHHHNPQIQIVVVLRNPIERAYSAYWYARRRGWETLSTFEDALEAEAARLAEDWYKWRNCLYLYHGLYIHHLFTLFDIFDRKQIHIFLTEDLACKPVEVCQKLFRLFNIDPTFVPRVNRKHNQVAGVRSELLAQFMARFFSPRNPVKQLLRQYLPSLPRYKLRYTLLRWNEKPFFPPPMKPETKKRLREYYEPHNAKLAKLLGRDLSIWHNYTD